MPEEQLVYSRIGERMPLKRLELCALVLAAGSIPCQIGHSEGSGWLLVPEQFRLRALEELERYDDENRNWPPVKLVDQRPWLLADHYNPPTILFMGGLLAFYALTGPAAGGSEWFLKGSVDTRAILYGGEWWRLVTALTLHSDPVHLLGNILIGGVIIHFLCLVSGIGLGWFVALLSGVSGNWINVWFRGPGFYSVGFSTAVFGVIGALCGLQIRRGELRGVVLPAGSGLALLAFLGSSGERTDLGSHLWGGAAGLVLGLLAACLMDHLGGRPGRGWQAGLLLLVGLVVSGAWYLAMS